jgi:hypothetical protein
MFDTHTHHPVPDGTIERIEKAMIETARKEAGAVAFKIVAADRMDRPASAALVNGAVSQATNSFTRRAPLHLEPSHSSVKTTMKECKLSEKEAFKAVRIALCQNALYQIADENGNERFVEIARAMLSIMADS